MNKSLDKSKDSESFLVVGSDTGVGKTIFSGLFGKLLKDKGFSSRLIKPFCSGSRGDIDFLSVSGEVKNASEINYWYSDVPISPGAWELNNGEEIDFVNIIEKLKKEVRYNCDILIIEGVGGLLAPISLNHTVASLGQEIGANLIIIAPNQIGVINHVLLTLEAAISRQFSVVGIVLMEQEEPDASSINNAELIRRHMPNTPGFRGIFQFPWLGKGADNTDLVPINLKKAQGVLEKFYDKIIKPRFLEMQITNRH